MGTGMGRPKKIIDLEQIREMASEFCTQEEISRDMGFSRSLFLRRKDIKDAYESGMLSGRASLRHYQFLLARSGNYQMLIWLGKQYLDQKEPINKDEAVITEVPRVVVTLAGVEGTVKGEKDE